MRNAITTIEVAAGDRYGFVDLTEELERAVKDAGVTEGCVVAYCRHTTCSLIINEWEDGALEDLSQRVQELVPVDGYFAHDDHERRTQNLQPDERANGQAHVLQMLMGGTSHAIPVVAGEPILGAWQRLFLFEIDEPKGREIAFHVFGE